MTREFVILPEFDKQWSAMGFADDDLKLLQEELTVDPRKAPIIQGTGGLRKIRVSFENQGKSGSARVCYVDFAIYEKIYLITAYPKNEKDNLTQGERNEIKVLIKNLEKAIKIKDKERRLL